MDYERIDKQFSQRGGLSPGKLRFMLLGVEKRRKDEAEMESKFSLRSEASAGDNDDKGGSSADECRDVDIVSSVVQCSGSMEPPASGNSHIAGEQIMPSSRIISQADDSFDSESVSSNFDFHKGMRISNGSMLKLPFSKSAPSKWDDAQKWIASPAMNRPSKGGGPQLKKPEYFGLGSRQASSKFVMEDSEDPDTKRIDAIQAKKEAGMQKPTNLVPETCPLADPRATPEQHDENLSADAAITVSRHDSSASVQSVTTFVSPASTMRSVGMRDMGTEMTPIASQEPSRTGTPVRATSPMRSATSSRPSSPRRVSQSSDIDNSANRDSDFNLEALTERELHIRTRREIMILGTQLGKTNIAAWASKEEEKDASVSLKTVAVDLPVKNVIEARAAAWEEAEKAKYMARLKREEIKILAWENHQKAKTEAEMRKVEVEVERMRARAHDRLMTRLAAAKHKAENMRAAAEAKKIKQAAKTAQQAEYIRRTGRIPSSFTCWSWCY